MISSNFLRFSLIYIILFIPTDIIHGKLDQKNSQLEVDYAIGRDTREADLGTIITTLQEWCDSCEAVLSCVDTQMHRANAEKNAAIKHRDAIETEVINKFLYFIYTFRSAFIFYSILKFYLSHIYLLITNSLMITSASLKV